MPRPSALRVLLVVTLFSAGCNLSHEGEQGTETDVAALEAVGERFANAVRSGDVEAFAELFTLNATYAANNGQFLTGRQEIIAAAREWFQVPMQPTGRTLRAEVYGRVAYLVQEYSNEVRLPNGTHLTVTGKSLGVFRREKDGSWKIEALVVNRDPESR